ncbi:WD repeat-containing protein 76 [Lepeophtheirus salmonis]|uniref:WD repeat-containing protein 76 n=1 Tax=Lepeophtheirus salmonis TaxID=72036 RepID=A0A0K2TWN7_LEPSM|nr:WD repeat-containing protein 76-like [Lepeophtheirus salmonis]
MKRRFEDENEKSGLSEYEKIRQKNIREREEKLLSLGIIPHVNQPKKNATLVKSTIKINSVPVRSSPRLKGLQANEASEVIEEIQEEEKEKKYIPKRDLTLKELLSYECDPEELSEKESSIRNTFESYASLKCKRTSRSFLNLSKLKIKEDGASKVCRARITSMAFHPSTDQILLFVGDVHGYTSIFNLRDPENVHSFKSNDWTINCMSIDNHNASKLVTTSYDGSMKLLDLRTQQIELLYGEDFSFASYHSQIDAFQYLLSFGRKGTIGVIDLRRGKGKDFASKINVFPSGHVAKTVSYKDNLFVVGNSKSDCLVYDIRKSTSPYAELKGHSGAVSSAFFNPNPNSREILMTVKKDKILLYNLSNKNSIVNPSWSVRHNNQTGRWLSSFKAVWHPIEPYIFVGSMEKPRRLDIFDSYGDIVKNLAGQWLTSTASVVIPHPVLNLVAGGNSSGRVFVFKE